MGYRRILPYNIDVRNRRGEWTTPLHSTMALRPLFCLSLVFLAAAKVRYDGHTVFRVHPTHSSHVHALRQLQDANKHDFWTEPRIAGERVDIMVHPQDQASFKTFLKGRGIGYDVMMNDVQRVIDQQEHERRRRSTDEGRTFTQYREYDYIMNWMDTKVSECGSRCSAFSIGSSFEGRQLKVMRITDGSGSAKPALWVDCGIHAREWIAHATGMWFIDQLVAGSDQDVATILGAYDVFILPVMNPDGYAYSWATDRMWRKTRSDYNLADLGCMGADCNRNFDHNWNGVGTSNDPCSNTYSGVSAYSEPEAQAVANFVTELNTNQTVKLFLTTHSYSQYLLLPYGYTTDPAPNHDELRAAGTAFADALTAVHGTVYVVGSASVILYPSSGTSRDWAKGVPGIQYVYTIESRDTGEWGFVLPEVDIIPTCEETWAGFKAMVANFN